ncbi:MAG: UPF0262 family protein [Alphaproteobacteria bacterium]|nr:UPF0262 family protein [Alphaproteobacteria bacterium]
MSASKENRIVDIQLDQGSIVRWSREVDHERQVAIFDLLENNSFALVDGFPGPYRIELSLREANLIIAITNDDGSENTGITLSMRPFRKLIKDYFLICESYFDAIRTATPSRIEAIDMGRRGLHNDGAALLIDALGEKINIDEETARRLYTLICVLHIRG